MCSSFSTPWQQNTRAYGKIKVSGQWKEREICDTGVVGVLLEGCGENKSLYLAIQTGVGGGVIQ